MIDLDQILIHEGIGTIRFGTTKDHVIGLLGQELEEVSRGSAGVDIGYPDLQVTFSFWEEFDLRLGYIGTERKTAKLLGQELIGLDKSGVRTFIRETLKSPITEESGCKHEDGEIQEWIDVDGKDLSFWFLDDVLYKTDWMCAWVDGDTPDWPKDRS